MWKILEIIYDRGGSEEERGREPRPFESQIHYTHYVPDFYQHKLLIWLNMADVNIPGVVAIVVFYLLIVGIGLWAARRRKEGEEEAMLAGRSIGMIIGTLTMTGRTSSIFVRL